VHGGVGFVISNVCSASDEVAGFPLYFDDDSTHREGRICFLLLNMLSKLMTCKPSCSLLSLHVVGEFLMLRPRLGCEMMCLPFILESMFSYVLKLCNVVVI